MVIAFLITFHTYMSFIRKHSAQILVHILFWVLFIFVSLFVFSNYYWEENPFLHYLFILVSIVYANNAFLLPFFVKKQWYTAYVFVFIVISFLATQLYCNVFARCGCSIMKCLSDYLWQTLTPLLFFSFVWMLYRFIDEQARVEIIQKEHTEMELKFLKSQINPHVLLNNLNTIYSYAIEKPEDTPELILMLSDNLKHVLYDSNSETIPLEKELQFIDNYIKFQKIRTEGVKTVVYSTKTDTNYYEIAPLLLITIIENAFKHSLFNSKIYIEINVSNDVLECICENVSKPIESEVSNTNIGLKNLQKRLDLLYKHHYTLQITKGDVFKVYLKLDLISGR